MARDTLIKLRRGTGAPSSSTLNAGEPAVDTDTGRVYISTDGTDVVEVGSATASGNITGNLTVGGNTQVDGTVNVDGNTTLNGVNNTGTIDTDTLDSTTVNSTTVNSTTVTATGTVSGQFISSSGNISANGDIYASNYNPHTLDAAWQRSPIGLAFDITNGLLDINRQGEPDLTVDLDGRYLQYSEGLQFNYGTFTPIFADGIPGNQASFSSGNAVGRYISLKNQSGTILASFVHIFFNNGNTSGLGTGNNVCIRGIPSNAIPTNTVGSTFDTILGAWRGINLKSVGSQVGTSLYTGGSNGELFLIDFDETGGLPLPVSAFTSGNFAVQIKAFFI